MDLETAHVEGTSRFSRFLALLVGATALLASLLATLQTEASRREERALIMANRLSVAIFEEIAVHGPVTTFGLKSLQQALVPGIEGSFRGQVAFEAAELADVQTALSNAALAASERIQGVAQQMSEAPGPDSGVDEHTAGLVGEAIAELERLLAGGAPADPDEHPLTLEQNRQVDLAERYGRQGSRAVYALSLLAVAAVLLGLAGVMGEGRVGRIALLVAALVLLLSLGWGVSALIL